MPMAKIRYTTLRDDYPAGESDFGSKSGQFKARIHETIQKISDELDKLGAAQGLIELDIDAADLKRVKRGQFPSWGEERSPRVRLTFTHPDLGPLQYPCGTYDYQRHNLRAIALTLEALRAIERYGACTGSQQYEGFKGLPPGEELDEYFGTPVDAAAYVARLAGKPESTADAILEDADYFAFCYKAAAKAAHPDSGGSDRQFQTLQQARDLIRAEQAETGEQAA